MECTGKIHSINRDWKTNKLHLTLEINEQPTEEINFIASCEKLNIKIDKFKQKRSLDANAYCWVLISEIANHPDIQSSKEEVYEEMLQKYGFLEKDEEGYIVITLKESVDIKRLGGHWKFLKGNGKFNSFIEIKGSSKYNSAEMAHFINQIVLEAQELGIETLPPNEIERMKEMWGAK